MAILTILMRFSTRELLSLAAFLEVYNHWQLSFGVDTPEEAERVARDCGLDVELPGLELCWDGAQVVRGPSEAL